MKKIGILTHHSVYNFGANLQALSTQKYLSNKGFDPYIINWVPTDLRKIYLNSTSAEQCKIHEQFFKDNYKLTRECHDSKEIATLLEQDKFDAIVVGSDAVVRNFSFFYRYMPSRKGIKKNYLNSTDLFPNPYWGDFSKYLNYKIPMAMISVSSQGTTWKDIIGIEKRNMKKALERFSYISVRDSFTKKAFAYYSNKEINPSITPDPVFSFNQNLGLPFIEKKEPYVIFSFKNINTPPLEWLKELKMLFNKNGYKVKSLPFPQEECNFDVDEKITLPLSPLDWYNIIKKSSGYIGNNMHPVVVALHNSVPVFSFDYYAVKRNRFSSPDISMSKIYDLMKSAGFTDNYYNIQFGYGNIPDYNLVYEKVVQMDASRLNQFSNTMKEKYDLMMNDMIERIINE